VVYRATFHVDFNELLLVSMALVLAELFLNFEDLQAAMDDGAEIMGGPQCPSNQNR
jgi:hypothetical protein